MGLIPIPIQFHTKAHSRKEHREGRWIEQETQLAGGSGKRQQRLEVNKA